MTKPSKTKDLTVFCRVDETQFTEIHRATELAGFDTASRWIRKVLDDAAKAEIAKHGKRRAKK